MGLFSLLSINTPTPPPLVAVHGPKAQILVPSGSQFAFFAPDKRGRPQNERAYGPYSLPQRRRREVSPAYSEAESELLPVFERERDREGRRARGAEGEVRRRVGRGGRRPELRGGAGPRFGSPEGRADSEFEMDMDDVNGMSMGMGGMDGRRPAGYGVGMGAMGGMPMGMDGMTRSTSAPAPYGSYPGMAGMGAMGDMGDMRGPPLGPEIGGVYPGPMGSGLGMGGMGPPMGGGELGMGSGRPPAYGPAPGPGMGGVGGNPYAQYGHPSGAVMPEQHQPQPKTPSQPAKRRLLHVPAGFQSGSAPKITRSKPSSDGNGQGNCKCGTDPDIPRLDSLDACVCSRKCSCKGGVRAHYFGQDESGESIKGQIRYVLNEDMGRNCSDHRNCYTADGKRKVRLGAEEQCEASRIETKGGLKMLRKELAEMNEKLNRLSMGPSSSPGPHAGGPYPSRAVPPPSADAMLGAMSNDPMMGRPSVGPPGMSMNGETMMADPRMGAMGRYPPSYPYLSDMNPGMDPYGHPPDMMDPMMMGMGGRRRRDRPLPGMMGFRRPPPMGMRMPPRGGMGPRRGPGMRRRPDFVEDDMDMGRGGMGDLDMDEDEDWEDLGDDMDDFDEDRSPRRGGSLSGGRKDPRPGGRSGRGRQAHVEDDDEE